MLRRRRLAPASAVALTFALAALAEPVAHAQTAGAPTITINPLVTRKLPDGSSATIRPQNLHPTDINFSDCEQDQTLHFAITLGLTGGTGYSIQAWAGTSDCTAVESRTAATATCWPLNTQIALSQATSADIRVRDIVGQINANPKNINSPPPAGEDACHPALGPGPVALTLYFMVIQVGAQAPSNSATYPINASLVGPSEPTMNGIDQGDTLLVANWSTAVDPNIAGFNVYCDPPVGGKVPTTDSAAPPATTTPTDDGGDDGSSATTPSDDAGGYYTCLDGGYTDATYDDSGDVVQPPVPIDAGCSFVSVTTPQSPGASGGTCSSNVLVGGGATSTSSGEGGVTTTGGIQRAIDPAYLCGTFAGSTTNQATVTGLTNGVSYTIAVAATDTFGNDGPLSDPKCATPVPIDDFWKQYRDDGGQAGGGFCSTAGPGIPVGGSLFAFFGIASAVTLVRRRRMRRERDRR